MVEATGGARPPRCAPIPTFPRWGKEKEEIALPGGSLWLIGGLAVTSTFIKPLASVSFLLFAVLTAGGVVVMLQRPDRQWRMPPLVAAHLRRVGLWSYSMYLIHQPLLRYVPRLAPKIIPNAFLYPLGIFALCLTSWFLIVSMARWCYYYLELPSIALGKWYCQVVDHPSQPVT